MWEEGEDQGCAPASETELWRPSPKVAGGSKADSQAGSLSHEGVLAVKGNLQPLGKVVFILEENRRVRRHNGQTVEPLTTSSQAHHTLYAPTL